MLKTSSFITVIVIVTLATLSTGTAKEGFQFGSYGRVQISTDAEGGTGKPANVVSHGVRLEEDSYTELDLSYSLLGSEAEDAMAFKAVFTLALFEDFFHFTGAPTSSMAIRNLYGVVEDVVPDHLDLWVGSRMYRGDDIYLFDYWPMDNLNTLGGGAQLSFEPATNNKLYVDLHFGLNQLLDSFYTQEILVSKKDIGSETLTFMERQKLITSLKATYELHKLGGGDLGMKIRLYGELHAMPEGTYYHESMQYDETLPADSGLLVGVQLGLWGYAPNSFLNVWVKYATGLAAYGELSIPWGLAPDKTTTGAKELLAALMTTYDFGPVGVMLGAYIRSFEDADVNDVDLDDYTEFIVAARPQINFTQHLMLMLEVSYQQRLTEGLSWTSGYEYPLHSTPSVFKLAVMPTLGWGTGAFDRPQIRLVYAMSMLNDSAMDLYNEDDPRSSQKYQHFVGLQIEWWFHSSYK